MTSQRPPYQIFRRKVVWGRYLNGSRSFAAERDAITSRMPEGPMAATAISYEPFAGCFFNGDDPVQLMQQVPGLLAFQIEPSEPFAPLAEIDPYACNLRLRAISIGWCRIRHKSSAFRQKRFLP